MPREKVLAFLKSHPWVKKPENNRFRVPIHSETNRFTLEKFPPPLPLLHPNTLPMTTPPPSISPGVTITGMSSLPRIPPHIIHATLKLSTSDPHLLPSTSQSSSTPVTSEVPSLVQQIRVSLSCHPLHPVSPQVRLSQESLLYPPSPPTPHPPLSNCPHLTPIYSPPPLNPSHHQYLVRVWYNHFE